jgi:hypothetical protein
MLEARAARDWIRDMSITARGDGAGEGGNPVATVAAPAASAPLTSS